jgi:hypothetical protein
MPFLGKINSMTNMTIGITTVINSYCLSRDEYADRSPLHLCTWSAAAVTNAMTHLLHYLNEAGLFGAAALRYQSMLNGQAISGSYTRFFRAVNTQ